jgi:hypothetical protein
MTSHALRSGALSWDVVLQKFDRRSEATFDLAAARRLLGRASGFCEVEPGIGEIEGDGYAEIYYGVESSSDVMVSVRAISQEVIQLICEFAAELCMAVFVPTENSWGAVVLDPSLVDDLPDESWEGWENFGDGSRPPTLVVCEGTEDLAAVLRASYDDWQTWAHGRE